MDRAPSSSRTRRQRTRPGPAPQRPSVQPSGQLLSDLAAIGLCLLAILLALGLYFPGTAGAFGGFLVQVIRFWMGSVVYVAPLLFLGAGISLAMNHQRALNVQAMLGVGGLLVMLFGWVHLASTPFGTAFDSTGARLAQSLGRAADAALVARPDGGLLGALVMGLTYPLGVTGAYITLGALGAASVLLITELTLRGIFERVHERSKITAERVKKGATAVGEGCKAIVPARRQKQLFLDVGDEDEEEEEEVGAPVRAIARVRKSPVEPESPRALPFSEAAVAGVAAMAGAAAPTLPLDDPEPEIVKAEAAAPAAAARTRGKSFKPVRREGGAGANGTFTLPPLEILDPAAARPKRTDDTQTNIDILVSTLGQFRIEAEVVEIADGPSVTRYEVRLGEGVRVRKILDLADNIAMSLAAMSVRVEAPIPGKAAIGIEVPKKHPSIVTLRECLESNEARDMKSKVGFVLGKDVAGEVRCADLARMPHLLVAGATNSGKSVCLNVLIASMLFRARPDELKFIMIDPKRVELTLYDGIPHLIHPVVKDVKQAAGILRWVLKEMDRRYDLFAQVMTRNIEGYNEKVNQDPEKRLPFLVVVIDELADLMMQQGPEVEQAICRLAQLARATGIHLVIATQRPSVDVITGLIKANVPSRIAFSVSSQIDSRTILDQKGAENLIGRGDMLFKAIDANKPTRIQGAFLREGEVEKLVNELKQQGRPEYIAEALSVDHGSYGIESQEESEDELFEPAARFVVTTGHASTSMIQRKFKIGYTRAARLVDMMEGKGIVGALDGAKPREIMMSRDQLDEMFAKIRGSLFRGDAGQREEDEEEELLELEDTGSGAPDPFVED